jgi:hypothetical protein
MWRILRLTVNQKNSTRMGLSKAERREDYGTNGNNGTNGNFL